MLKENLENVEQKIQAACERSGRDRSEITLIAVSKTKPAEMVQEAYDLGIRLFGENKVQEIMDKSEVLPADIHWHMIGHLQRNKIKYIIDKVDLIHSVDSLRLAEAIEKEAAKKHLIAKVLIEVNVGREESKFGFLPEELDDFVEKASDFSHIQFMGLMTSAPFVDNPEENRPIFAELRKLSVDIAHKNAHNFPHRRTIRPQPRAILCTSTSEDARHYTATDTFPGTGCSHLRGLANVPTSF